MFRSLTASSILFIFLLVAATAHGLALGPDGGGYRMVDQTEANAPAYALKTPTFTVVTVGENDESAPITIPFTFTFYGVDYTQIVFAENGYVTFIPGQLATDDPNFGEPIPGGAGFGTPNAFIAGVWEDMDFAGGTGNKIRYGTAGTTPNRIFTIEYNLRHAGDTDDTRRPLVQINLLEADDSIEVAYQNANNDGGLDNAGNVLPAPNNFWLDTAGIEDATGAKGIQYFRTGNNPSVPASSYVRYENKPPNVVSVNRVAPPTSATGLTNATLVTYTVTFDQIVFGVAAADFEVTTTGEILGAFVSAVTGTGATRTVTVNTGTGDGTLRLDVITAGPARDNAKHPINAEFRSGQVYTIDKTPPQITVINRVNPSPTGVATVNYAVTFSETVTGFVAADLVLVQSGVTGATIGAVTGSGTTYNVVVNTGTGSGTIGLNADAVAGPSADGATNPRTGNLTGQVYTIDKTLPTVTVNQKAEQADPVNTAPIEFTAVFSEPVLGFENADVTIGGTATGTKTAVVSSTDNITWNIAVSGMTAGGTVTCSIAASKCTDAEGNNNVASTSTDNTVTYDIIAPVVNTIVRQTPSTTPTNATSVTWRVTFTEVNGINAGTVDVDDFTLVDVGDSITGESVTQVAPVVNNVTFDVTANTGTGDGTLRLEVLGAAADILDNAGNDVTANFSSANTYVIDKTLPTVLSVNRLTPLTTPTNAATVTWQVTFSEPVTGLTTADFSLVDVGGTITGETINSISGTSPWTTTNVAVATGTGNGTLQLNVLTANGISDVAGNVMTDGFSTGQTYVIDKTAPTVTVNQEAGQADPTFSAPIEFTAVFSEAVTGFDNTDVTIAGTSGGTKTVVVNSTDNITWNIAVSGMTTGGTVLASIAVSRCTDLAGNNNAASTTTDNSVTWDPKPAVVSINRQTPTGQKTNAAGVTWRVTFSENVTGVAANDFTLVDIGGTITGEILSTVTVITANTVFDVAASTGTGDGELRLDVMASATITDSLGQSLAADFITGQTYIIDKTPPQITAINRVNPALTNLGTVNYTVTFGETVTGFVAGDLVLVPTGVTGAAISTITGSGTTYNVAVTTGTGSGTIGLNADAVAGPAIDAAGNQRTGNLTGQVYTIDKAVPSVTVNQKAGQPDPTNTAPVEFTAVFSEAVTGFDNTDVALAGTSGGTKTAVVTTSDNITWNIAVSGMTTGGTVLASIAVNRCTDAAGNNNAASTTADNSVTWDVLAPVVASINRQTPATASTNAASVVWRVTFTEVNGINAGTLALDDFTLVDVDDTLTGELLTGVAAVNATTFDVTASSGTGEGTLRLDLLSAMYSISDLAGNPLSGDYITGQTFVIDRTVPTVLSVNRLTPLTSPANVTPVIWQVTFSEPVTSLATNDFSLVDVGGTITGETISSISGTTPWTTTNVTVATGTGNGTLQLNVIIANGIADVAGNAMAAGFTSGQTYVIDKTAPTVTVNQKAGQADPARLAPVEYTAVFSEAVTGFDNTDVTIGGTAGGTKAAVVSSADNITWNIAVSGMTTAGTVLASIAVNRCTDLAGNNNAASTTSDNTINWDATPPAVSTMVRQTPATSPTNAASVVWRVTFSETVNGVDTSDFTLVDVGDTITGEAISSVSAASGTTIDVTVNTGTGDGTLRLDALGATANITDAAGNDITADYVTGPVYVIDKTLPTVLSVNRLTPLTSPTNATSVTWQVTFSESVSGLTTADFSLVDVGGTITGEALTSVSAAAGVTVNVVVNTGTGSGELRLNVVTANTITDTAGNVMAVGFTTGQTYMIDKAAPTVTVNQKAGQPDPTFTAPIEFTAVFSEAVSGFDNTDVTIAGTSGGTKTVVATTSDNITWNIAVSGMTTGGTVLASIAVSRCTDAAGNNNTASTTSDNTVTWDPKPVVVSINRQTPAGQRTNAVAATWRVTFSENVSGVMPDDFTLVDIGDSITAETVSTVTTVTASTVYDVAVGTGAGDGELRLDVLAAATITDATGQPLASDFINGQTYIIDKTQPQITGITRVNPSLTNLTTVNYTVTYDESVTGVVAGDFTLVLSGVTGATVGTPSGSGTTWNVPVNTGTGNGTIRLDADTSAPGPSVDLAGNQRTGSFSGEVYTMDKAVPTVTVNQKVGQVELDNTAPIEFTAVFSEAVTGFDGADITITGTAAGTKTSVVTTSDNITWNVAVSGMTTSGTVICSILAGKCTDMAGNSNAASSSTDNTVTWDVLAPAVTTINRQTPSAASTNAASVVWRVTFTEVNGINADTVDIDDFTLVDVGNSITSEAVTGVAVVSATVFDVTVNTGTGDGTLRLDVLATTADILDNAGNPLTASFITGQTYGIDKTAPTVVSVNRKTPPQQMSHATTGVWTVTFSESVSGLTIADFAAVVESGSISGASVTTVSAASGTSVDVTANTGTGDGTLRLDVLTSNSILDTAGNAMTEPFDTGQTYIIDKTPPTVSSIVRLTPSAQITNAASVTYAVTFNESVNGLAVADFTITDVAASITGEAVSSVSAAAGTTVNVTVNTGTGNGTLRLDVLAAATIYDDTFPVNGNDLNVAYTSGETYIIDKTAPTITAIRRSIPATGYISPRIVTYAVTFSEAVTGVTEDDFVLASAGVSSPAIGTVDGSGTSWTVEVDTGTGTGAIQLRSNSVAGSSIDIAGNLRTGSLNGQIYSVESTPPVITAITRDDASPTNASSVNFTVSFSEAVTGFAADDLLLVPTGITGASIGTITDLGNHLDWVVTVNTGSGSGTIGLNADGMEDGPAMDNIGNERTGEFTGEVYSIDKTPPEFTAIDRMAPTDPVTDATSVIYSVTLSEAVTGLAAADFELVNSIGITGASIGTIAGSDSSWTVEVNTGLGDGTLRLDAAGTSGPSVDSVGNPRAGEFTGQEYTIDKTAPYITGIAALDANPSKANTVRYSVTFNEDVTGVAAADFEFVANGVTGASISGISGSGDDYTVTINTGSGNGTIGLNANSIDGPSKDVVDHLRTGTFTGEVYTIDKEAPSISAITRVDADPSNASIVNFAIVFSEPVTGVSSADFTLVANGVTGASFGTITGADANWNVSINTGLGSGSIGLDAADTPGSAHDAANNLRAGAFTGEEYTIDKTPPSVDTIVRLNPSGPRTNATSVDFAVTFSESVVDVAEGDFAVVMTDVTGASITNIAGSGTDWTVTVNTGTGEGTVGLNATAGPGPAKDEVGNARAGAVTGAVYTIDRTAPHVTAIARSNPPEEDINDASVTFAVTFDEDMTGLTGGDFELAIGGLVTTASITSVTGGAKAWAVEVNTGSGDGTLGLNAVTTGPGRDLAGNPLGEAYTVGETYAIDKTAPEISVNVLYTKDNRPELTGSVTDSAATISIEIGTQTVGATNNGDGTWTLADDVLTALSDGTYDVKASASDTLGNVGTDTTADELTIDTTPPSVTNIRSSVAQAERGESVTIIVAVTDVHLLGNPTVTVNSHPTVFQSNSGDDFLFTYTVPQGAPLGFAHIAVTATDGLNEGTGSDSSVLEIVDITAPSVVSITPQGPNPTTATHVVFDIVFNEDVKNVDATDIQTAFTGTGFGAIVVNEPQASTAAHYTVDVTGIDDLALGSLTLSIGAGNNILDLADNVLALTGVSGSIDINNTLGVSPVSGGGKFYTGDPVNLSITKSGGRGPFTFTWKRNGEVISGAPNAMTYPFTALASNTQDLYTCTVTDTFDSNAVDADDAIVEIRDAVAVTDPDDVYAYTGTAAVIQSVVTGGYAPLVLRWYKDADADGQPGAGEELYDGGALTGTDTDTLRIQPVDGQEGDYFLVAVDANPAPTAKSTDTSSPVTLVTGPPLTVLGPTPGMVQVYNDAAPFTMSVTATGGIGERSFEWFRQVPPGAPVSLATMVNGTTDSITINPSALECGDGVIYCVVKDKTGEHPSNSAPAEIERHLSFISGLSNATAALNRPFMFKVEVDGGLGELTYHWYKDDGKKTYILIEDEDGPTLTIPSVSVEDATLYQVVVLDVEGNFITSEARLSVDSIPMPAANLTGLVLLAMLFALGGVVLLRHRKERG